ncbi:MIP/aquaporin family protein [Ktedonobacter racemifer]|uniref:Major intrinsic protein n=1 Tax=Ktedonobacter racemifer DSM 44963 TaxID=485913 RepID=D6TTL4_KTERA|nr:MIP/aquaporin family protein [Ktedonobacter racemifer]EFH83765.1 major intrinsic protein [Ktedonobacter racemifer DSM 44963]
MQKHFWWQRLHWPEYGSELLGTAFLVFIALSAVAFTLGSGSPLAAVLPKNSTRWLITGLLLAASGPLVAISPLGKLSGAHLNPAVSLAFWLQGKMHQHDLVGYLASQMLGAVFGAGLAVLTWRERAASVHNGITVPGRGYPIWSVFLIEMGFTCLLVLAIFLFLSSHHLMRWTPLMTWLLVAFIYWVVAPISGSSLNPARSFGPALVSWFWRDQWVYVLASPIGALLAVGLYRSLSRIGIHDVLTAKLFHAPRYRCIFKNVIAPQINTDQDGKLIAPREGN